MLCCSKFKKFLTGKTPSANFITKCYLDCLNDADRLLIERALTSEKFNMSLTVQLVELFSSCICSVPTPDLFPLALKSFNHLSLYHLMWRGSL